MGGGGVGVVAEGELGLRARKKNGMLTTSP